MTSEQIIVELIADSSSLDTAIEQLVKLGTIDQQVATSFKTTTAEINKQASAIGSVGTSFTKQNQASQAAAGTIKQVSVELNKEASALKQVSDNAKPAAVNLEQISVASKNISKDLAAGLQQGIVDALEQANVSVEEFKQKLSSVQAKSPFAQLNKELTETAIRSAETTAALEKLKQQGATGSEAFVQLEKQLEADRTELQRIEEELSKIAGQGDPFESQSAGADKASKATSSLKKELRALTEQIAVAKANGKDFGDEYESLVQRAGRLKDAIGDANQEIANTASDTSKIDGLITGVQGIAGAFAAAQGATALFGDSGEELQQGLLKLNATMAILQGLQSASNAVLKESGFIRLFTAEATNKQTIAQKLYNVVVGQSTGALKVFKIALASTGIGLLIIAIGALIANWDKLTESINGVSEAQKELEQNSELNADAAEEQLQAMEGQEEVLKRQGKSEAEILKAKVQQVEQIIAYREQQLQAQIEMVKGQVEAAQRNKSILAGIINFLTIPLKGLQLAVNKIAEFLGSDFRLPDIGETLSSLIFDPDEVAEDGEKTIAETKKEIDKLNNQKAGFQNKLTDINKAAIEQRLKDNIASIEKQLLEVEKGSKKELELQKKLIDAKAALEIAGAKSLAEKDLINTKRLKDRAAADVAAEKTQIDAKIKSLQSQLQLVEKGSREELRLKQDLIQKESEIELLNTELTEKQKQEIIKNSNDQQLALARQFNEQLKAEAVQNAISLNNAELAALEETSPRRLQLLLSNIDLAAQQEIAAAKGNAAKIKEINANRERDIRDTQIKFIDDATAHAIEKLNERHKVDREVLEAIVADERNSVDKRIDALNKLKDMDIEVLNKMLEALKAKHAKQLISDEAYADAWTNILKLLNKVENDSAKKSDALISENTQKWISLSIEGLQQLNNVFAGIGQIQADNDANKIAMQRKTLESEKEAGAITEKQAVARAKKIDAEEAKMRRKQAERAKSVALFSAILDAAKAVTNMLATNPGPQAFVAAAIAAAAAAAQVALIASKPIPKFKTGKKHLYEGFAEVAEDNKPEIIETRKGRRYLAKVKSIVWLNKEDKVYTNRETSKILRDRERQSNVSHQSFYDKTESDKEVRSYSLDKQVSTFVRQKENNSLAWLGRTTNNYKSFETQRINLVKHDYVVNKEAMKYVPSNDNALIKELKAEMQALGKAIKNHKGMSVNIDKEGITEHFLKTMSETTYFNNRYTFRGK